MVLGESQNRRSTGVIIEDENIPCNEFLVDAQRPDQWRKEPYYSDITQCALASLRTQQFAVRVVVGRRTFLLVPASFLENRDREFLTPVVAVISGGERFIWAESQLGFRIENGVVKWTPKR